MYRFKIELAGTVAEVETIHEASRIMCRNYLTEKPAEISIKLTEGDIEKEREFATSENPTPRSLEYMALYRKLCTELASMDTVLFHGSCLKVDGQAYLFCAQSGTGKSTHTRLWREYLGDRAIMINDDKPLVRVVNDQAVVYGTPWSGKHHLNTNISAPLKAICFLERGEKNIIERLDPKDSFPILLKYTFWPEDAFATTSILDTAAKIADLSAFWSLKCNMDPEAAKVAFTAMSEG